MSTNFLIRLFVSSLLLLSFAACSSKTPEEHLQAARQHMAEGSLNAAIIEAKNALQKSNKFADARGLLGDAYYQRGEYATALSEYERAMDLGLADSRIQTAAARCKLRVGRVQEVIGELQDAERNAEQDLVLAEGFLLAGDPVSAKPLFEAQPDTAEGQAGMGALAWNEGDLERAGKHYARALELGPDDAQLWLRQGELLLTGAQYEEALASFSKAETLPGGKVSGTIGVVRTMLAQEQVEQASAKIDELLKIAPDYPLALYLRGLVDFQQDNITGAETSLRAVQSRYPDHGPTQYLMGLVKYKLGQYSQAEENLKRYLARDDSNESVRKLLASVRFDRGDMKGVIELLQSEETVSQDPQTLAMLGSAKLRSGDLSGATSALERAVELAPNMAAFRNQLALTLLSSGNQQRAEAALQDAISVDENQFQSDYLLAMLKLREADYPAATEAIEAIVNKSPENPIGYNLRGAVLLAKGDKTGAREQFEAALGKSPTFQPAANNLARLLETEGQRDAAEAVYQRVVSADETNEGGLIGLAEIAVRNQDPAKAIAYLEKSVAGNAGSLKSRLGLARLLTATGKGDEAQKTVAEALEIHKNHPDFLALQAQLDLQEGNRDRALRSVAKLQSLLATNPKNLMLTGLLAELQIRTGNRTMARRNYESLLELTDKPPPNALLRLARFDLAENKLDSAEQRLQQLQAVKELQPETTKLLEADILAARGDEPKARAIYQQLSDAGQRDGSLRLATMMLRDNQTKQGTALLESWLQNNEADQGARALLAGALLQAGDNSAALTHYERLKDTGNPVVLNNLAWIYMELGDVRAIETARQAVTVAPDNADIADTYGWVLVQMGSPAQGVRALEESLKQAGDNPTVMYHLAVGYQKIGSVDKAKQMVQKALLLGEFAEREEAEALLRSIG